MWTGCFCSENRDERSCISGCGKNYREWNAGTGTDEKTSTVVVAAWFGGIN